MHVSLTKAKVKFPGASSPPLSLQEYQAQSCSRSRIALLTSSISVTEMWNGLMERPECFFIVYVLIYGVIS